jgi:Predicted ring-cleavage extradiol dioxygenase
MSSVTEIRHVGLCVPDLEAERSFYKEKWGLREVAEQDGLVYFRAVGSSEPFALRLRGGTDTRVDVIELATDSQASLQALYERVQAAGLKVIFAPRPLQGPGGGVGFRFFSPDGLPFGVSHGVQQEELTTPPENESLPLRISHVVLHSPDVQAAARFFVDVLGFRVSDWLGDFMCFLRCNAWHHRIAVLPGPPCLNHMAWDMADIDAMMRGVALLRDKGVQVRWGPGRHKAGNNTFSYFVTPNGFATEYTAELELVDEASWQATVYEPHPSLMDVWGIGVGGPYAMPRPEADAGLFQPAQV